MRPSKDKIVVFDIEATGNKVNDHYRIGALKVLGDADSYYETDDVSAFYDKLIGYLEEGHVLSGHNIIAYDIPLLIRNVYRGGLKGSVAFLRRPFYLAAPFLWDTLLFSRRFYPKRKFHGMGSWLTTLRREQYSVPEKTIVEGDWATVPYETLQERVKNDVFIQEAITHYMVQREGLPDVMPNWESISQCQGYLMAMLCIGVPYDKEGAVTRALKLEVEMNCLAIDVKDALGGNRKLNLNSNAQISKALEKIYGQGLPLGPPSEKTQKCSPLMNKRNKMVLQNTFPVLQDIYRIRDLKKQHLILEEKSIKKSNFSGKCHYDTLYKHHFLFPKLGPFGLKSFRNQFTSPSLNALDKRVRDVVNAPKGFTMIGCDIVALEMTILGYVLKNYYDSPKIWDDLKSGKCPKQQTIDVFDEEFAYIANHNPSVNLKDLAKTTNYAILFGSHSDSLCHRTLGLPSSFKKKVKDHMEERFEGLTLFHQDLCNEIDNTGGCIRNLFGVLIPSPHYCAINYYCQSSGTEYSLMVLSLLYELLDFVFPLVHPTLTKHCLLYTSPSPRDS